MCSVTIYFRHETETQPNLILIGSARAITHAGLTTIPIITNALGIKLEKPSRKHRLGGGDLLGYHLEAGECTRSKRSYDRDICGVAPARHQDAADARYVIPRVEGMPASSEVSLEPSGEVPGR